MTISACISIHCGLHTTLKLPNDAVLVSFVNPDTTQTHLGRKCQEGNELACKHVCGVVLIKLTYVRRPWPLWVAPYPRQGVFEPEHQQASK